LTVTTLLATVLGVSRWLYLAKPWVKPEHGYSMVACCDTDARSMVLEYRMREPFRVVVLHRLERPSQFPKGIVQSEVVATLASEYDLLRGYFVRLRVSKGRQVAIEAKNEAKRFAPWSVADASKTEWAGLGERVSFSDGLGVAVAELAASGDSQEVIELYAATDGHLRPLTDWSFGEGRGSR
jgi:hypothetical protein